jgi:hypothetical protein
MVKYDISALKELSRRSKTAISEGVDNCFDTPEIEANVETTIKELLIPFYEKFGKENVNINSFYRNGELNGLVGGANNSAHKKGFAIDFSGINSVTNRDLFLFAKTLKNVTELIWEFGDDKQPKWVHVGIDPNKKRSILKSVKVGKITKYIVIN